MSIFKFKQFSVDQANCAMKINTDGVLLGALAQAGHPARILDIGTGTGVIALMLAQRFTNASITAVEIDAGAAETARANFSNAPFANRLTLKASGFETYFEQHSDSRFDLIVSNPPFFLNSLTSPGDKRNLARHTDTQFYTQLMEAVSVHLTDGGTFQLILPIATAELVTCLLLNYRLHLYKQIAVCSFPQDEPHRYILIIGHEQLETKTERFVIYDSQKKYSAAYRDALERFFMIF